MPLTLPFNTDNLRDAGPTWLYENATNPENRLRCIHGDRATTMTFYENMSRAYARMARQNATIMHSHSDYASPPLDGIWGRIELPTIRDATDIFEMKKISEDSSLSDDFTVPRKAPQTVWRKAMKEVRELFRKAEGHLPDWDDDDDEEEGGSCNLLDPDIVKFLDDFF